jgi:hypothetical protein
MYLYSVLPSTLLTASLMALSSDLAKDISASFTTLPTHQLKDPFPLALRHTTLELASNNLICSVALTGVLALQAGRFWAESSDEDDLDEIASDDTKGQLRADIITSKS